MFGCVRPYILRCLFVFLSECYFLLLSTTGHLFTLSVISTLTRSSISATLLILCSVVTLNFLSIVDSTVFICSIAYFCPTQFLDPAPNGMNAKLWVWRLFSGRKRSGQNSLGLSWKRGSRCNPKMKKMTVLPAT